MKLTDLRVDGFGIWTGVSLNQLSDQLTVFYGPNEAGKTTLLQFIRTVLYGFSTERRGRYLPPVHGGRPGGQISLAGPLGRYHVERHTSLTDAGTSLGEVAVTTPDGGSFGAGALATLLSNVDEAIFNNVFAVGLRELQELNTIDDTAAAELLYKLTSGLDRVSLVDVMRELVASRERLLSGDDTPSQITTLLKQRDRLLGEIDDLAARERRWSRLTEQRLELDSEAVELSRRAQDLEQYGRLLDITVQVSPAWQRRAKLQQEIDGFGPLQELPEGAVEKLDALVVKYKEQKKRSEQIASERERLKNEIAAVPVKQALCDAAAKIELYQEQLPWIRQLDEQGKRIGAEMGNLASELGQQFGDIQLPEGVSREKLPEVSRKTLAAVLPASKQVRREASRIKQASRDAEAARSDMAEIEQRISATLGDHDGEDLAPAIEKASQRVQQIRRRIHLEERIDAMSRQRTELRIANRELDDAGLLPMPKLVGLGAAFIFGVVMVLMGLGGALMYEMTGALAWCVPGMLCIGGAIVAKQVLEKSHSSITATTEVQLEQLEAQLTAAEHEREELDRKLPRGGGALDRRLQTAQAELEQLEEVVPLEAQRHAVRDRLQQAEMRLAKAQGAAKEARHKWKSSLRAAGLPEVLAPEHVRSLARRCAELATIRRQHQSLQQEYDQRQKELGQIGARIGELFLQAEITPQSKDPQQQLKQLATALAEAQGHIARRDGLRANDRSLRKEARKLARRLDDLQRRRRALLVSCCVKSDLQLRERAAFLEEAARLTRLHDELAHQIAAMVRPQYNEEQVAAELGNTETTLAARRDDVARHLAETQTRLADVYQQRGEIAHELKTLVEDRRLAQAQLELASVERNLGKALHRWRVLAATWVVLDKICKLYEAERQPETLIEASHYLAKLTRGQYTRIWTPLGDKALRVDDCEGHSLRLEVLSTGTREAIFLSLRLALIAGYARRGAKLPIVLDDVLVNLDRMRMKQAAAVLRDFAVSGHQLLLFTCHEHIKEAFEALKVEVRRLPTRGEPVVVAEPPPPKLAALPIVEMVAKTEEELGLADEPEPAPLRPPARELALAPAYDEGELRLSSEELPTRAELLDDLTVPHVEPARDDLDFTVAEAPEAKSSQPLLPPRREKKPRAKPQSPATGFEELRYDDAGSDARPHRFTWESPERWGSNPGEQDAA